MICLVSALDIVNTNFFKFHRSGWDEYYYKDPVKFLGTDKNDEDSLKFPGNYNFTSCQKLRRLIAGFGKSAIDWLLAKTTFVGIGVDTLSIELGRTQACYVHQTLTKANKYGLECLANLQKLPLRGFTVTVLPLKIEGGSGGPCRVIAKL